MNTLSNSPGTAGQGTEATKAPASARRSRLALLLVASTALVTALPVTVGTAAAATPVHYSYTGLAYGTSAAVGSTVTSGRSAVSQLGCTSNGDLHRSNSTAGINLAPLAKSGTIATTADTLAAPVRSRSTARTAGVNLLNGVVRATAVQAASATTKTATGYQLSSQGTTLVQLVVAGVPVRADAAPNTRVNVAGFGYVIVNEQIKKTNGLTVNGVHLFVTTRNVLGVAVGSTVVVSGAVSGLSGAVAGVVGGLAYGTRADVGTTAVSGRSFPKYMPCLGTGGAVRTNTGAGVTLGTAIKSGTITDTVQGTVTASAATAATTSTVQSVNLLNGLVKASVIRAKAHATGMGGSYSSTDTGSSFGTLTVAGHPEINAKVAANTRVTLSGIGTLTLHRVVKAPRGITVIMIELKTTSPVNGLAVGTVVRVAGTAASIA